MHYDVIHLPTTQKAVTDAIIHSMVSNDSMGHREVFTDNRYSSIELAIFLRERCKVLTSGTIRKNRKGMDKDSERVDSKIYYNKTNKVAIAQWYDNKVVTVVSTLVTREKVPSE